MEGNTPKTTIEQAIEKMKHDGITEIETDNGVVPVEQMSNPNCL